MPPMFKYGGLAITWKFIKFAFCYLIIFLLTFLMIEGPLSTKRFLYSLSRPLAERAHTKYDELLGWTNIPNLHVKDMYGSGVYLRTNSQSFRNNKDFSIDVPDNNLRIICSGDSFTLGYGVDNDHTWCHRLTSWNGRFETVNMGQGGYGIDQSYLWYMRDGNKLDHHMHIFAFIEFDITRINRRSLFGYPKPILKLKNDTIFIENIPVPEKAYYVPWLTRSIHAVNELRSTKFIKEVKKRIFPKKQINDYSENINDKKFDLLLKIFETLHLENKKKQSIFVVVFLPTRNSYNASNDTGRFFKRELAKRGILFLDLIEEFKKIPGRQLNKLFISGKEIPYKFAAGHYSAEGNQYVAKQIYNKLSSYVELEGLPFIQKN